MTAVGGAVKLRPLRGQRLAQAAADLSVLEPATQEYTANRSADNVFVVNIESLPAMENLDAILASPNVDALLIGPHDLSVSLGIPERYDDPKFDAAVRGIIEKGRAAGAGVGIHLGHAGGDELIRPWMEAGMNMLIYSADVAAFARQVTGFLNDLRSQLGDPSAPSGPEDVVI